MSQSLSPAPRAAAPDVLVLQMHYGMMKNYNYIVIDPGSRLAVVVDPAWQVEKIEQALRDAGATLCEVLITHSHPDHINLARQVSETYDCPIRMSMEEIAASRFDAPRLSAIEGTWRVGGLAIEPILTPGHTPGSVCYRIGDNLFSGDVLFAEGCGMCPDLDAAHAMYASLTDLKRRIAPHTRIYPGHSYGRAPGQTMAQLLKENLYLQFTNPNAFAAFRMRSGQSMAKLLDFR